MSEIVLLFPSVHFVIKAEKVLRGGGVECGVVPVPKEVRGDCGLALQVSPEEWPRVRALLRESGLAPETVYEKRGRSYLPLGHGEDGCHQQEG